MSDTGLLWAIAVAGSGLLCAYAAITCSKWFQFDDETSEKILYRGFYNNAMRRRIGLGSVFITALAFVAILGGAFDRGDTAVLIAALAFTCIAYLWPATVYYNLYRGKMTPAPARAVKVIAAASVALFITGATTKPPTPFILCYIYICVHHILIDAVWWATLPPPA